MAGHNICEPQIFSGHITEDVNDYMETYDRISAANGWSEAQRLIMFPLYLREQAKKLYKRIEAKTADLKWADLKKEFLEYYNSEEQQILLRENLNKREKQEEESLQEYILNVVTECSQVSDKMTEEVITKLILKGLPEDVYWKIYSLDNSSVDKITKNVKAYEVANAIRKNPAKEIEFLKREMEKLRVSRESNSSDEVRQLKEELERVKASINNRPFRNNDNFRGNSNNTGNFRGNPNNNSNNTRDRNYNNYNRASDNNSRNRNYNNNNRYNGNNYNAWSNDNSQRPPPLVENISSCFMNNKNGLSNNLLTMGVVEFHTTVDYKSHDKL
ncbi:probable serine/threonine-protein kinase dyrk1 [Adelges cooleyi]|uniref:probable serine/threonine-protein kinase dyrk1 n=1 Tax=Adelges cooleyi TaxID=133065 RepID=UPI0021807F27|nr:probable serine/threonine-protein kinase dyrk1 [Adelges cooleyi]